MNAPLTVQRSVEIILIVLKGNFIMNVFNFKQAAACIDDPTDDTINHYDKEIAWRLE